jgi:hypothetical protein
MLCQLSYSRLPHQDYPWNRTGLKLILDLGATRKDNRATGIKPEPPVRFELTTARLRIECSTPELRWRFMEPRGIEPLTSAVRLQRSPN